MRVMVLIKANDKSEAGEMPSQQALTDMMNFNEDLVKAGVMLAGDGLTPSSQGARIAFNGSDRKVIDGPFPETKELLAGYRVVDVDSLDRALEIAARSSASPGPRGVPLQQQIEVRQVISAPEPEL